MAGRGCGCGGQAAVEDATAGAGGVPRLAVQPAGGAVDTIVEPSAEQDGPPWLLIANVLGLIVLLFKIFGE